MCDVICAALGRDQPAAFLSGPSFARELMDGEATGLVVASSKPAVAALVQTAFASKLTRVYSTDDVIGVEVGGAIKNVFAIACGIADGMGCKYNTAAMLVTRGCSEMRKLAVALGARDSTLSGLSGYGDLMLTCT
jgi:glycerol-3-phosphate dehydrogenase